jgi:hypothetical protein
MDLSKLPKLSQTERPPGDAAPQTDVDAERASAARRVMREDEGPPLPEPGGPEAWMSFGMGVLLLLLTPRLLQYLASPSTFPNKWKFTDPAGNPLAYTQTVFFWSDLAMTAFCVVLICDALILLKARNRTLVAIALGFTVLTTLGNLAYLVGTFNSGIAFMSALAVLYGGYIATYEWRLLTILNERARARSAHSAAGA